MMTIRGVRGAITVEEDSAEAIWRAARELLAALIAANDIREEDVASVLFTTTPDLRAAHPARAARDLGWNHTALMGMQEMDVPGSLPRCIRVLIHWNTTRSQADVRHIFLRGAAALRPDLSAQPETANGRDEP